MQKVQEANITGKQLRHEHLRRLRLKTFLFLVLMAMLGPSSNVMLRAGMKHIGAFSFSNLAGVGVYLGRVFSNLLVLFGVVTRILFQVVALLVLSWADYSFVTPASAINYAIVAVMGHFLLGETVSPVRWIGIAFICLGVALVGITPTNTTSQAVIPAAES